MSQGAEKSQVQCLPVMSNVCVQCARRIAASDGLYYYLGDPYFAVLHKECAPYFPFNGLWPHLMPMNYYVTKSDRPNVGKDASPGSVM